MLYKSRIIMRKPKCPIQNTTKKSPIIKRWQDEKIPCHKTLAKVERQKQRKRKKQQEIFPFGILKMLKECFLVLQ